MEDGTELPLLCPKCQHTTLKTVRWVRESTFFTCPACGTHVLIDKDAATKTLAEMRHDIG